MPHVGLPATDGASIDLADRSMARTVVLFAYPRTGRPGTDMPADWDSIPGARWCTPEACSFRDLDAEFQARDAEVFGVSTQDSDYQREAVERLRLPNPLLSDADLRLTRALDLPTFRAQDDVLLRRLTLVLRDGQIQHVLYPVFPPDQAAATVLEVLRGVSDLADGPQ
ncbi:redoxin family protein [soil metagenome]